MAENQATRRDLIDAASTVRPPHAALAQQPLPVRESLLLHQTPQKYGSSATLIGRPEIPCCYGLIQPCIRASRPTGERM